MTEAQLRASLEKAGFKDVKIVDSAYVVNAQTADGGRATMYVDPSADAPVSGQGKGSPSGAAPKSSK
jgi:hypothetical protein